MRTRDIHNAADLAEIAYNRSYAVARREQSQVLRALFKELFQKRRARRTHQPCHA